MISDLIHAYDTLHGRGLVPEEGWQKANVPYALVLDPDGEPIMVQTLGEHDGRRQVNETEVPFLAHRSGKNPPARFLADNGKYMFAMDVDGKDSSAQFATARELHHRILDGVDCPEAKAILAWFDHEEPERMIRDIVDDATWESLRKQTPMIALKLKGGDRCAHEIPPIREAWDRAYRAGEATMDAGTSRSIVTGEPGPVALTHPKIRGVSGAQSSGASLISFNADAFESYGKSQNLNAPMAPDEAYKYTTALNTLLSDKELSPHRSNDLTVICWSDDCGTEYRSVYSLCLDPPFDGTAVNAAVRAILSGKRFDMDAYDLDASQPFHVLGLRPENSRLHAAFYWTDDFGMAMDNVAAHYRDTGIDGLDKPLTPFHAASQTGAKNDALDRLQDGTLRSILTHGPYPRRLYLGALRRIRADRKTTPSRMGILKACLSRRPGVTEEQKETLTVQLNEQSDYAPYVLGRMFSVYERLQRAAQGGLNASIKDRWFAAAATSPAKTFARLALLGAKHMRKLQPGLRSVYQARLDELAAKLTGPLPIRLNPVDQGIFALGYYHQDRATHTDIQRNKDKEN